MAKYNEIIQVGENMLSQARENIDNNTTTTIPIAELATLGAGISSLIPSLHEITQSTSMNPQGFGLYKVANASVGDTLKVAKNGNFWGSLKTPDGKSKFVQLKEVNGLSSTSTTIMPIDPATIMMAASLFAIEKRLSQISEIQKHILEFLEREKKAEIEADIKTLISIINKYKLNWTNEHFMTSSYKMILDIQRTARKNMIAYQKEIEQIISLNKLVSLQSQVNTKLNKLQDKFNYYRLSLYTYSLASLLEIMLGGNFREEYIAEIRNELASMSITYRTEFNKASIYIEKLSSVSVETNILKGVGSAARSVGDLISTIPIVKDGPIDEFLQDEGKSIKENAKKMKFKGVNDFASISNPGIAEITQQMDDMINIYNHTSQIYFDNKKIYLISNQSLT